MNCGIGAFANLLETYGSRVTASERELINFRTDVNELYASKSALDNWVIAAETCLKDVNDIWTVRSSCLRSLRDEVKYFRRQGTIQTTLLASNRALSA